MNLNNNIIIILLVIVILVVFIFFTNSKEKFVDTNVVNLSNVTSMDDKTAINTLAQISKSLMTGGLTVPGDINIRGKTKLDGDTSITGDINVTGKINNTTIDKDGNINAKSINVDSINIGGKYKLSYDSTKNALIIDNGVNTGDNPSVIFIGPKCRLGGANDESGTLVVNKLWTPGTIGATGEIRSSTSLRSDQWIYTDNIRAEKTGMIGYGRWFT